MKRGGLHQSNESKSNVEPRHQPRTSASRPVHLVRPQKWPLSRSIRTRRDGRGWCTRKTNRRCWPTGSPGWWLTWNLMAWILGGTMFLYNPVVFRFHVNFPGCNTVTRCEHEHTEMTRDVRSRWQIAAHSGSQVVGPLDVLNDWCCTLRGVWLPCKSTKFNCLLCQPRKTIQ